MLIYNGYCLEPWELIVAAMLNLTWKFWFLKEVNQLFIFRRNWWYKFKCKNSDIKSLEISENILDKKFLAIAYENNNIYIMKNDRRTGINK